MRRRQAPRRPGLLLLPVLLLLGASACAARRRPPAPAEGRTPGGIAYEAHGSGDPVLLIHGAFLDRRQWRPQLPLARRRMLVRYDTRWHGRSASAVAPFAAADDARDVLDALGLPAAHVVGLSNGARIAIDVALAHPGRVRSLVLVSPDVDGFRPTERPPFWTQIGEALARGDADAAAAALAESPVMAIGPADSAWIRTMVREHARVFLGDPALERRGAPPALERLGELRVPTLVVIGGADLLDIRRAGREIARRIPGARLVEFPGAPHLLTVTDAERFNRLLVEFTDPLPPR